MKSTVKLDANSNPIPSYTQSDVEELARVLTGWDLYNNNVYGDNRYFQGDYSRPMEAHHESGGTNPNNDDYHDFGSKTVLGHTIAANLSVENDLNAALDIIFQNPNVGSFIANHLILRLVTSNPSSAYVQRVAAVFNDNGNGVRGDLAAVVKAILLDSEAREPSNQARKAKEPWLAYVQYLLD